MFLHMILDEVCRQVSKLFNLRARYLTKRRPPLNIGRSLVYPLLNLLSRHISCGVIYAFLDFIPFVYFSGFDIFLWR